jgi:hypothetical protein
MLKRSLIAVVAVAVLATVAQAGYIKTHDWPTTYVPQELTTIPVYVDVGYFVKVLDQSKKIKMHQITGKPQDFEGSVVIKVKTNFDLTLIAAINPKGAPYTASSWGVNLNPENVNAGTTTDVTVTASCAGLAIENVPANTEAEVATVKISVVPR